MICEEVFAAAFLDYMQGGLANHGRNQGNTGSLHKQIAALGFRPQSREVGVADEHVWRAGRVRPILEIGLPSVQQQDILPSRVKEYRRERIVSIILDQRT